MGEKVNNYTISDHNPIFVNFSLTNENMNVNLSQSNNKISLENKLQNTNYKEILEIIKLQSILNSNDYYDILGININANNNEIKAAFRQKSLLYHPNKIVHNSNKIQILKTEVFQKINNIKEFLLNKENREIYDEFGLEIYNFLKENNLINNNKFLNYLLILKKTNKLSNEKILEILENLKKK
jgi:hypothetical protein